jgi:hypothetical protein
MYGLTGLGFGFQPPAGSVNYTTMNFERSGSERTMGIFNALTSILFAYGELYC